MKYDIDFNNVGGIGVGTGKIIFESTDTSITSFELNFYGKKLTSDVDSQYNVSHLVSDQTIINQFYNIYSNIDYKQRLGWMFGYRKSKYENSNSYTTEGVLDLLGQIFYFY